MPLMPVAQLSWSWLRVFHEPFGEGMLAGARAGGEGAGAGACQWWAGQARRWWTCWPVLIVGVGMLAALRLQQGGFRTPWVCEGCGRPTHLPEGVVPSPCRLCGIRLCIDCVGFHNCVEIGATSPSLARRLALLARLLARRLARRLQQGGTLWSAFSRVRRCHPSWTILCGLWWLGLPGGARGASEESATRVESDGCSTSSVVTVLMALLCGCCSYGNWATPSVGGAVGVLLAISLSS